MKNNNNKMSNEKGTMRNYASSLLSAFSFLISKASLISKAFLLSAFSFLISKASLLSAFSFLILITSCSNELDEALQPAHNGTLQFVVSDFPAFGENPETRAIGNQDAGKTAWAKDDQIIITLTSQKYGKQVATLIYDGSLWNLSGSLLYLENEKPTVCAYYAPCNEVTSNTMNLRTGMLYGMTEYLVASDCKVVNNTISISFDGVTRDYSRLRIAALADQELSVTTTGFTPAGATSEATEAYTLTTDNNGNAFLYGVFSEGATVSVKYGDVVLKDYTFTAEKNPNGTEQGKSYALDARPIIDGTLGGDTDITDDDIKALVDKLKYYVDNGITTIIVPGSNPATYSTDYYTTTAIGEAIYRLSGSGYNDNSTYLGKIDLILPDVTEIVDYEFEKAYALNSITLPKVTKLGYQAFNNCRYLQKITFGSVVTEGTPNENDFLYVGEAVDGCVLVLNSGQADAAAEYRPNTSDWSWWKTLWKRIQ